MPKSFLEPNKKDLITKWSFCLKREKMSKKPRMKIRGLNSNNYLNYKPRELDARRETFFINLI